MKNIITFTNSQSDWGLLEPIVDRLSEDFRITVIVFDVLENHHFARVNNRYIHNSNVRCVFGQVNKNTLSYLYSSSARFLSVYPFECNFVGSIILGDRVEMLSAATISALKKWPIHHLFAGDMSGCVDDNIRDAITVLSSYAYVISNQSAERCRLLLKNVNENTINPCSIVFNISHNYANKIKQPYVLSRLHPETTVNEPIADYIFDIVQCTKKNNARLLVQLSNLDDGFERINELWFDAKKYIDLEFVPDLDRAEYLGLLQKAVHVCGNSSSFVIDTALVGQKNVTLYGHRQYNRRAPDLIGSPSMVDQIKRNLCIGS